MQNAIQPCTAVVRCACKLVELSRIVDWFVCFHSSVGQSVRLLTSRSGVRASQGASFGYSCHRHWGPLCQRKEIFETLGRKARLAQSVERKALNLVVVGSSLTVGVFFIWSDEIYLGQTNNCNGSDACA